MSFSRKITYPLAELRRRHCQAEAQFVGMVSDKPRRFASRHMRQEKLNHTLQATGFAYEPYIHLLKQKNKISWENRAYFFAAAANTVQRILGDHARAHTAAKRGAAGRHYYWKSV